MANRLTVKGDGRKVPLLKKAEAEKRNENSADDKRRAFWRLRGFSRESQAKNLVAEIVSDINANAKEKKQRSEDWPILPEWDGEGMSVFPA